MRKITFGGAVSLDGFLARPDHAVDWLRWSDDVAALTSDYWKGVDAVLMGRRTYEAAAKSGQVEGYPGVHNYVFSRTLTVLPGDRMTLVKRDAVGFVRNLKAQAGKEICLMGGGALARPLFEAGLIDEVGLNIHPLLLGGGVPVFHQMARQTDLDLKECRTLKNGCAYLRYSVKQAA